MKYVIVQSRTIEEVASRVNALLKQGDHMPLGAPVFGQDGIERPLWMQAMLQKEDVDGFGSADPMMNRRGAPGRPSGPMGPMQGRPPGPMPTGPQQ